MIELALASGQPISEVEQAGPRGWATIAELVSKKD